MTKFLSNLPRLVKLLLAIKTDSVIGFKIPTTFTSMIGSRDKLVIHYYAQIGDEIKSAAQQFVSDAGITPVDRSKMGASDSGVDVNGKSDTEVLAQRMTRNVIANKDQLNKLRKDPQRFRKTIDAMWGQISREATHR